MLGKGYSIVVNAREGLLNRCTRYISVTQSLFTLGKVTQSLYTLRKRYSIVVHAREGYSIVVHATEALLNSCTR